MVEETNCNTLLLQNIWNFNNDKAIAEWDRRRAAEVKERQRRQEELEVEEERRRVLREAEEEQVKQEERKNTRTSSLQFPIVHSLPLPFFSLHSIC